MLFTSFSDGSVTVTNGLKSVDCEVPDCKKESFKEMTKAPCSCRLRNASQIPIKTHRISGIN